ncbi:MAG: adenosylcobinamide-phosphate synthase CbiB [Burkholderiales bacterium]
MFGLSLAWLAALAWAAVALDRLLGEPPTRWHPLVAFGRLAQGLERWLNRSGRPLNARVAGLLGVILLVGLPTLAAMMLMALLSPLAQAVSHCLLLSFALGGRSLHDHVAPVAEALLAGDLPRARRLTARIVSRDLDDADEPAVARAAVESTLENGSDAIFGALCWFVLAGGPGALAFRLANTLDAMWGYRSPRYLHFGWAAARFDDLLGLLPARVVALSYALAGHCGLALRCWHQQAAAWASPNAGPVMAAGAGALGVALGGPARYQGVDEQRPPLGAGPAPRAADVLRALALVDRTLLGWLLVLAAAGAIAWVRG